MSSKHTPTPWRAAGQQIIAEENGYRVAVVSSPDPRARGKERMEDLEYCRGNTAFIVRACNSHEQLVTALQALLPDAVGNHIGGPDTQARIDAARAAIAKATGGAA